MALVILGKTSCHLCGRTLLKGEDVVAFRQLFYNQLDPIWVLSDAGVHRDCLIGHGMADRALCKLEEYQQHLGDPKICVVCREPILDPDDYFATGPVGDGPDDPLQAVSWIQAHLSHLPDWEGTPELLRVLEETLRSPEWESVALEWLVRVIRSVWNPE